MSSKGVLKELSKSSKRVLKSTKNLSSDVIKSSASFIFSKVNSNWTSVLFLTSVYVRTYSLVMLIPAIVAFALKDYDVFWAIFVTFFISFFLGLLGSGKFKTNKVDKKNAIVSLALGWIFIILISMIPFLFTGLGFIDSLFESTSCLTGSGFTAYTNLRVVSNSVHFYRGLMAWVGGFGIAILALMFFDHLSTATKIFDADGRRETYYTNIKALAQRIVIIYTVITLLGMGAFYLFGVPIFDSFYYSMTTLSTAGNPGSDGVGIGSFGYGPMLIASILSIIGVLSFSHHYRLSKGDFKSVFKSTEFRLFYYLTLIVFLIVVFRLIAVGKAGLIGHALFYIITAFTNTGAGTPVAISNLGSVGIFLLIILMFIGGSYGSTSGGIKLWRFAIILQSVKRAVLEPFYSRKKIMRVNKQPVSESEAFNALSFILTYLLVVLVFAIIFMVSNYGTVIESLFTVMSAMGGAGIVLNNAHYAAITPFLKLMLCLLMAFGRLEIYPFLILARYLFFKEDK